MTAKPGRQTGCRTSTELNSQNNRLALNTQLWKASAYPRKSAQASHHCASKVGFRQVRCRHVEVADNPVLWHISSQLIEGDFS